MSYYYRPRKKIFTKAGKQKEQYFAVAKPLKLADIDVLSEDISRRSRLRESTIKAVILELSQSVNAFLIDGYNVNIAGIGTIGVAITSQGFEKEEDLKPKHVRYSKVTYRPDKKLVSNLKQMKYIKEPPLPKSLVTKEEIRASKQQKKQSKLEQN